MAGSVEYPKPLFSAVRELTAMLPEKGIAVLEQTEIPYGIKLACSLDGRAFQLVFYSSAKQPGSVKLVVEGKQDGLTEQVYATLSLLAQTDKSAPSQEKTGYASRPTKDIPQFESRIGTDESGKGDYFGPLVVAGVYADKRIEQLLSTLGAADSKKNDDKKNRQLAKEIRQVLLPHQYNIVVISPVKYNELYEKMGRNLNVLLSWAHARVIENLLEKNPCGAVIVDQFGSEERIKRSIMKLGQQAELFVTPKGERDMAVAAASILARDRFLESMQALSEEAGMPLEKGASVSVEKQAKMLIDKLGMQPLSRFAKLHFKTTEKAAGGRRI